MRTPPGFKEAFQKYCEDGWNRLGAPEAAGGAGLPSVITFAFTEMGMSANQAFSMYPGLTTAAYSALWATGEPWMKEHVAKTMISGEWTGTMCLTEPHCGTDLKLMKTKAVEQEDGTYRITGTKIFISGGDHDMTDNIIHMVIAKIPDEDGKLANDLSTVNFFMVPKMLVDKETGEITGRNGVSCGSIEKKMGIKGNATAVLNFDEAVAYRLGGRPPEKKTDTGEKKKSKSAGMAGMFGMMNGARMGVGIQGIAIGEVAYQNGVTYANERLAGRSLTGAKNPDGPADPIMVFPDVRRLLISSRSFVEGARALAMYVSMLFSLQIFGKDEKEREEAADMAQLMTPIIKAFFTDKGFQAANDSMQVFGGHGYVRDHGMEQFVR
ncbi:MAG: acyl-CoA dehydrogenase family protein, partial [Parvibaculum sp.]